MFSFKFQNRINEINLKPTNFKPNINIGVLLEYKTQYGQLTVVARKKKFLLKIRKKKKKEKKMRRKKFQNLNFSHLRCYLGSLVFIVSSFSQINNYVFP